MYYSKQNVHCQFTETGSVPRDAMILGVDNETVICETASPPLSSIALDTREGPEGHNL